MASTCLHRCIDGLGGLRHRRIGRVGGRGEALLYVLLDRRWALSGLKGPIDPWPPFPGAVHEGNGEFQLFIDESATAEQRDALEKIVTGEDTEEMATMWWIFTAMCSKKHPTQYRKITTDIDVDKRVGTVKVDGILDIMGEPIKNPVTGAEHRARIDLPNGFEYKIAEMGSASTTTKAGEINLIKNKDSYAQFAELHLNNAGVVR